jgi:hypothetical protein
MNSMAFSATPIVSLLLEVAVDGAALDAPEVLLQHALVHELYGPLVAVLGGVHAAHQDGEVVGHYEAPIEKLELFAVGHRGRLPKTKFDRSDSCIE